MTEKQPPSDRLPSYSESVSTRLIPQNIAQARSALISDLVQSVIAPQFYANALSGLSSSTLLIVPTNVPSLQPDQPTRDPEKSMPNTAFPGETIVGFPSTENVKLMRLQGQENSLGFWSQFAVILELKHQVQLQLHGEGYQIAEDEVISVNSPSRASTVEWRTIEKRHLQTGQASVEAAVREICLRCENPMGLYETRTGQALVVKIDVGQ